VSLGKDDTSDLLRTAEQAFAWTKPDRIAVAVSGGSDSMAALHLIVQASAQRGWRVHAVTVDHRLRPEAADEARLVARVCGALGVLHETLIWEHTDVTGNLMDAARHARYDLITRWAIREGIGHVALGHTADDQAETFLMGLARAAGLDGLSGMRPAWTQDGIVFARPFLEVPRARLKRYLQDEGIQWIDDPTNDDDSYTRIKARRALDALRPLGITVDGLARVTENLAMAQGVVRVAVAASARSMVTESGGGLLMDRAAFHGLQFEVQRRILLGAFSWMSGAPHPPRAHSLHRIQWAIITGKDATLCGCRTRVSDTAIRILREPKAVAALETPTTALWDHRWHLDGPHADGLTIRALGYGLRLVPNWRDTGLPRDALIVTPAVWQGDALIAAPLAGLTQGWTATLRPAFASFLLSH
jgi:tRNA(Ile)-lysidine synthase